MNSTTFTETVLTSNPSENNSTNLLALNNGWIGDDSNSNNHELSALNYCCDCPVCSTGNFDTNLLQNNGATNTLNSSSIQPANNITTVPIEGILSTYKWGFSWGNRTITYSFYENDIFGGRYYGRETGVREVSEGVKNNVRSIFNSLKNYINVDFVEVAETNLNTFGRIRFMDSNGPSYAYAYYPYFDTANVAGDVHLNPAYDGAGGINNFQGAAGTHGYMSLIHEIGHALGLKHPHDSNPVLNPAWNNADNTVMTYSFLYGDKSTAASYMPLDIKALQSRYGAKVYNSGDNVYRFTDIDTFNGTNPTLLASPNDLKQTLWDSGGQDTFDLSGLAFFNQGYRVDLNPGGFLTENNLFNATNYSAGGSIYQSTAYGTRIAFDVVIEDVVNSSSSDTIFLNSAVNTVKGYAPTLNTGADVIHNASSQDRIDLTLFDEQAVTKTIQGNDLILQLNSSSSITLKNYHQDLSFQLQLLWRTPTILTTTQSASTDNLLGDGNSGTGLLAQDSHQTLLNRNNRGLRETTNLNVADNLSNLLVESNNLGVQSVLENVNDFPGTPDHGLINTPSLLILSI